VSLSNGDHQQLENLCRIFDIEVGVTSDDPEVALVTLQVLYGMPLVEEHSARHRYGLSVLQSAGSGFGAWSPFVRRVGTHVAMMQELPHWYGDLNRSPAELADIFESLAAVATWLRILGIGIGGAAYLGTAVRDGVAEAIKKASIREGIERAARRLLGQGSLLEAISTRMGARFTGIIGALLVVGGTLAYHHAIERMAQIQEIMMHQYQSGNVPDGIMRRVTDIDPSRIMRYWQA
jgi:hypothetical protein